MSSRIPLAWPLPAARLPSGSPPPLDLSEVGHPVAGRRADSGESRPQERRPAAGCPRSLPGRPRLGTSPMVPRSTIQAYTLPLHGRAYRRWFRAVPSRRTPSMPVIPQLLVRETSPCRRAPATQIGFPPRKASLPSSSHMPNTSAAAPRRRMPSARCRRTRAQELCAAWRTTQPKGEVRAASTLSRAASDTPGEARTTT